MQNSDIQLLTSIFQSNRGPYNCGNDNDFDQDDDNDYGDGFDNEDYVDE